jgi:hypothetical protein
MPFNSITGLKPYGTPGQGYAWDGVVNIQYDTTTLIIIVVLGTHNLSITGGQTRIYESHIDIMMGVRI